MMRRRPARSVTSSSPLGRNARLYGYSRPARENADAHVLLLGCVIRERPVGQRLVREARWARRGSHWRRPPSVLRRHCCDARADQERDGREDTADGCHANLVYRILRTSAAVPALRRSARDGRLLRKMLAACRFGTRPEHLADRQHEPTGTPSSGWACRLGCGRRESHAEVVALVPERTLRSIGGIHRPAAEELGPAEHVVVVEGLVEIVRRLVQVLRRPALVDLLRVLAVRRRRIAGNQENAGDALPNERIVIGAGEVRLPGLEVGRDTDPELAAARLSDAPSVELSAP